MTRKYEEADALIESVLMKEVKKRNRKANRMYKKVNVLAFDMEGTFEKEEDFERLIYPFIIKMQTELGAELQYGKYIAEDDDGASVEQFDLRFDREQFGELIYIITARTFIHSKELVEVRIDYDKGDERSTPFLWDAM